MSTCKTKRKRWTAKIDIRTIPDTVLFAEAGRRRSATRKTFGAGSGRPQKIRARPGCGRKFNPTDMRIHKLALRL